MKYEQALSEIAVKGLKSLFVDFLDLFLYDSDLALRLLSNPKEYLKQFNSTALIILRTLNRDYANKIRAVNVRFRALHFETPLHKIGAEHIGKLVMVSGSIVRLTAVRPFILKSAFRCRICGEMFYLVQRGHLLQTPEWCTSCRSQNFEIVVNESVFIDSQWITIKELPLNHLTKKVDVILKEDIVNIAKPNRIVNIIGFVELINRRVTEGVLRDFDFFISANNIEIIK